MRGPTPLRSLAGTFAAFLLAGAIVLAVLAALSGYLPVMLRSVGISPPG